MNSKIYACISLVLYVALLVVVALFVKIESDSSTTSPADVIYIEYVEPEPPQEPEPEEEMPAKTATTPVPNSKPNVEDNPPHKTPDPEESTQQSGGEDQNTRTINPLAQMPNLKDGVDKPADVGNPKAEQDTVTTATGTGRGLSQYGDADLDKGLEGRGCDYLAKPKYPSGNKEGKIVVRVIVDPTGKVEAATFEKVGSNTTDADLVNAAIKAAKSTKFRKIDGLEKISGTIIYRFKLN